MSLCLQNTPRLSASVAHPGTHSQCIRRDRPVSVPLWSTMVVSNHGPGLFIPKQPLHLADLPFCAQLTCAARAMYHTSPAAPPLA